MQETARRQGCDDAIGVALPQATLGDDFADSRHGDVERLIGHELRRFVGRQRQQKLKIFAVRQRVIERRRTVG